MNEIDGVVLGPEPEKTAYNHNSVEACVASGIVDPSKIAALLGFVNHEDPELLRQIDVEKVKLEIRLNDILLREAENGSVRAAIYLLQTIFNIAIPAPKKPEPPKNQNFEVHWQQMPLPIDGGAEDD